MDIVKLRHEACLTQNELATQVGVTRSALANWEIGLSLPPSDKLPQLADALHCSIDALFGREANTA